MKSPLEVQSLHPFHNPSHPASCAYRMHLSPHEWTWTQEEQEAMANAVIEFDKARNEAGPLLREIHHHPHRNGPIQVLAGKLMKALGIEVFEK